MTAEQIAWMTWTVLIAWLAVAGFLLLKLRVFSPAVLVQSPARQSKMSLPVVGAIIVAFFFIQVAVVGGALGVGFISAKEVGLATATTTSAATEPVPATTAPVETLDRSVRDGILMMLIYAAAAIPVLLLVPRLFKNGFAGWGLHIRQIPRGILYGLLAIAIVFPLVQFFGLDLDIVYSHFQHEMSEHQTFQALDQPELPAAQRLFLYFSAVVIAPLAEELFFRGIVQTTLIQFGWGLVVPQLMPPAASPLEYRPSPRQRWIAIGLTALAFAGVHAADQAPVIFILALGLGYVYERTGNLWAAMVLHAGFNGAQVGLYLLGGG